MGFVVFILLIFIGITIWGYLVGDKDDKDRITIFVALIIAFLIFIAFAFIIGSLRQ